MPMLMLMLALSSVGAGAGADAGADAALKLLMLLMLLMLTMLSMLRRWGQMCHRLPICCVTELRNLLLSLRSTLGALGRLADWASA